MKLRRTISLIALIWIAALSFQSSGLAQWDKKPYSGWDEKQAAKVLNDSPWGQTQTATDTSMMFDTGRRLDSGQSRVADVTDLNFRIRLLSAKPIRQALTRVLELQSKGPLDEQFASRLKAFAAADFPDYVVVAVLCEASRPSTKLNEATALLNKLTTSELKNNTYLLVKGGHRIPVQEYQSPKRDGFGAKFIFPRQVDGKPLLTADSGEILFYSDLNNAFSFNNKPFALSMRFNVKEMMYEGKLEY
jgi:hypothetical protein